MPKFEVVAIHMDKNFKGVEILNHNKSFNYDNFLEQPSGIPFSEKVMDFLHALFKTINQNPRLKKYPDVASFSFFCRRANILKLKNIFFPKDITNIGRGVIFHIAPSNVPVNFAFSLITGLLAGNSNIVKISSKNFEQTDIIVDSLNKLSKISRYSKISRRIILVKYDKLNLVATKKFSFDCDVRIIWGGDKTINSVRENLLNPKSFDITFPDKYSIGIIRAEKYLKDSNHQRIAKDFYNDTFLFDQNACTSPHLIVWLGSKKNIEKGKKIFWHELLLLVEKNYHFESIHAIDKVTAFFNQAINMDNIFLQKRENNLIWRIQLNDLRSDLDEYRCKGGYFLEYNASSLVELSKIINKRYQTISYFGFRKEELEELIEHIRPKGIDRIVPIGRTMDFSLIWDGYNIIESLSRRVEIL